MGTTVKAPVLFCPKCPCVPAGVPDLVDHLVAAHDMTDEEAASRAVEIVAEVDPVPSANGQSVKAPRAPRAPRAPLAAEPTKTCSYCHRGDGTHTPKCRVGLAANGRKLCGHCKNLAPKHSARCPKSRPCAFCEKVAPNKCAHHGGIKKTSAEYKREKREGNVTPAAAFVATLASLTARIAETRDQLGKLEAAHAALSALR